MQNKLILSIVFSLMVLMQWFVPSKMIWDREVILKYGQEYLFECQPIDPNDPFRGKYITLRFSASNTSIPDSSSYERGQKIYLDFEKDDLGFAKISTIKREASSNLENSLIANVEMISGNKGASNRLLYIKYPFERFYMEESKAKPAEDLYRTSARDTSSVTYAVVMIKDGVGVIKDVMIDGVPIANVVANQSK